EGMALAKPIVASAIDGHEFLVKNGVTGYLSHSTEALAGSILLLLKNESKRREMGRMAHQRYMAEFSFESFIAKMRGLYDI
ncbi:MAG TPA: glycosyltransferase, partial [Candidatus Sumerlaeia bacterium]|nr:glycosyltransferase [Candidatus Sumerlaeia bacterium]